MIKINRIKYEDLIMKKAMTLFADQGLKFLGIEKKVKEIGATENVVLEATTLSMDYTFLMEDDTYLHFEFQSTDKGASDLRRFRAYEAVYSHKTGKEVFTYVIYTGNIISPQTTLRTGFNQYHVHAITMANQNGDHVLEAFQIKLETGKIPTNEDLLGLAFTPIMGGQWSQAERINKAVSLSHSIDDSETKANIQSILFAFANKFLAGSDLENIKEAIRMTQLGQMIYDDGIAEGILQGLQQGLQKGLEQGKQEGRQEGWQEGEREKSLFVATEGLRMGLDRETILRLSSLSPGEIEALSKELAEEKNK